METQPEKAVEVNTAKDATSSNNSAKILLDAILFHQRNTTIIKTVLTATIVTGILFVSLASFHHNPIALITVIAIAFTVLALVFAYLLRIQNPDHISTIYLSVLNCRKLILDKNQFRGELAEQSKILKTDINPENLEMMRAQPLRYKSKLHNLALQIIKTRKENPLLNQ